jgi:hypothetical protein
MANTVIALKKSATPSAAPADLANGELAINYADGKLYYKHANGTIAVFSSGGAGGDSFGTVNAAGTLIVADTAGDILTLEAGSGISITGDAINDKITIAATGGSGSVTTSDTAPGSPSDGDLWWDSSTGKLYIYYDDGSSSQWVEVSSPSYSATTQSASNTTIGYVISGGGSTITTGTIGLGLRVSYSCTIKSVTLLADQTGSIVIDIWKDTYANYPPTNANSITGSSPPTITSSNKSEDTTLSGWTTQINEGDILFFNVDSVTDLQEVSLFLKVTKT